MNSAAIRVLVVPPTGEPYVVPLTRGTYIADARKILGGWAAQTNAIPGLTILSDEDGTAKGLPNNATASIMIQHHTPNQTVGWSGTVILAGPLDDEHTPTDVPESILRYVYL